MAEGAPWYGSLSGKLRVVYFDREFATDNKSYRQGALGLEVDYRSDSLWDVLGVDISLYQTRELFSNGGRRNDILGLDNNGHYDSASSKLGQAALRLKMGEHLKIKAGRQKLQTLMLSSATSRAIPNTFSGVRVDGRFGDIDIYAIQVNRWSPRHDDHFESFHTDLGELGDIDYIRIAGGSYSRGPFSVQLEQLTARNYLRKQGLVLGYKKSLGEDHLSLKGGFFTSRDDGNLFLPGAESGDVDTGTADNDAHVYYLDLSWQHNLLTLGAALTWVRDDIWIEDNFSGDHGTTPFPTRSTIGPELTGKNENAWQLRAGYDWSNWLPGLTTSLSHTRGENAENTFDKSLGVADEWFTELDFRWAVPAMKGLSLRWLASDYHSSERGSVAAIKEDDFDHRFYLDYSFQF